MSEAIADDAVTQTPLQKVWGKIEEHGFARYYAEMDAARFAILTQQGVAYGYKNQDDSVARALRAFKYAKAYADEGDGPAFGAQSLYS